MMDAANTRPEEVSASSRLVALDKRSAETLTEAGSAVRSWAWATKAPKSKNVSAFRLIIRLPQYKAGLRLELRVCTPLNRLEQKGTLSQFLAVVCAEADGRKSQHGNAVFA